MNQNATIFINLYYRVHYFVYVTLVNIVIVRNCNVAILLFVENVNLLCKFNGIIISL